LSTSQKLKADWQVLKGAVRRGQVFRPQCNLTQPDTDIDANYDVAVPLSDCTMLTANAFASRARRQAGVRDPLAMCAHPYNNGKLPALGKRPLSGPPLQYCRKVPISSRQIRHGEKPVDPRTTGPGV